LGRYIFTDVHEIIVGGVPKELYEWLDRLADTQFEIRSRPPVVWKTMLIKKVKRVDNAVSRTMDLWFDNTIGGYITEFSIDRVELYSQAERYFFKGPRGKFLHVTYPTTHRQGYATCKLSLGILSLTDTFKKNLKMHKRKDFNYMHNNS
jgi:hypothetical protein